MRMARTMRPRRSLPCGRLRGRGVSLTNDILGLWRGFTNPEPIIDETPALRARAERLLRWLLDHPGQDHPCNCRDPVLNPENGFWREPCLLHAPGPRKTGPTGRPISVLMEVRLKVDLMAHFIAPFLRSVWEQARLDPPEVIIEVTDGFRRKIVDHAAIDDPDVLGGWVQVGDAQWKITAVRKTMRATAHEAAIEVITPPSPARDSEPVSEAEIKKAFRKIKKVEQKVPAQDAVWDQRQELFADRAVPQRETFRDIHETLFGKQRSGPRPLNSAGGMRRRN